MKIRWKYFLVLLCFSLIPLVVVSIINQHGTRHLGKTISANTRSELTEITRKSLALTAE